MRKRIADINQAFEDYEDAVSDLLSSHYNNFNTNLARFLAMLYEVEPHKSVTQSLPDVEFELWYEDAVSTVKGMVGSGKLNWPSDSDEYLAMRIALLRYIDSGKEDVPNFCSKFMYAGRHFDDMIAEFNDQFVEPTARDLQKRVERSVQSANDFDYSLVVSQQEPPWYQRPLGMILLGLIVAIFGGLAVALIAG